MCQIHPSLETPSVQWRGHSPSWFPASWEVLCVSGRRPFKEKLPHSFLDSVSWKPDWDGTLCAGIDWRGPRGPHLGSEGSGRGQEPRRSWSAAHIYEVLTHQGARDWTGRAIQKSSYHSSLEKMAGRQKLSSDGFVRIHRLWCTVYWRIIAASEVMRAPPARALYVP